MDRSNKNSSRSAGGVSGTDGQEFSGRVMS